MKFKFRFETVLKQRKVERDIAQRDYALAEAEVRAQMDKIRGLYDAIDHAREIAAAKSEDGTMEMPRLSQVEDFVRLQTIRITREREKARELLGVMEDKQEILAEKGKGMRAVEILKEKDTAKFKEELGKQEQKELDDLWMTRVERRKVNV